MIASPTGQGKTTAIERVLLDSACPANVVFMGDLRGDLDGARARARATSSLGSLRPLARRPTYAGTTAAHSLVVIRRKLDNRRRP